MDRISTLGNHKCLKGKIFPAVQPIIAVVLDSTKGGGDSFHGKVCELTSIGIKRGSAALWARPRVPGLIHELFRYERLTRFFCLSHFSISQERNHRWGLQWICLGTIHAILSRNFYPTRLPSRWFFFSSTLSSYKSNKNSISFSLSIFLEFL